MTRSEGTSKQLLLSLLVPYLYLLSEIHSLELSLISLPLRSDHELLSGMSIRSDGASGWHLGDSSAVVHKASISGSNTLVCYVEGVDLVLLGEPQVEAYVVVLEDCTTPQSLGADHLGKVKLATTTDRLLLSPVRVFVLPSSQAMPSPLFSTPHSRCSAPSDHFSSPPSPRFPGSSNVS